LSLSNTQQLAAIVDRALTCAAWADAYEGDRYVHPAKEWPPARVAVKWHSAAFTLDVYADALPQQMDAAGEKVADVIIAASGSILVANSPTLH